MEILELIELLYPFVKTIAWFAELGVFGYIFLGVLTVVLFYFLTFLKTLVEKFATDNANKFYKLLRKLFRRNKTKRKKKKRKK